MQSTSCLRVLLKVLDSIYILKELFINLPQNHDVCVKKRIISCLIVDIIHKSRDTENLNIHIRESGVFLLSKNICYWQISPLYIHLGIFLTVHSLLYYNLWIWMFFNMLLKSQFYFTMKISFKDYILQTFNRKRNK